MKTASKPLSELCKIMTVFPQVLINIHVQRKPDLNTELVIQDAIKSTEASLGNSGRVLVRYSGTRPLCRIMVEGPTVDETKKYCQQLSDIVKDVLGK
jgi:phosphoglucosamine mutase